MSADNDARTSIGGGKSVRGEFSELIVDAGNCTRYSRTVIVDVSDAIDDDFRESAGSTDPAGAAAVAFPAAHPDLHHAGGFSQLPA